MHNFNHLYYFYMTAKSGGVTAASKHLRLSQPSLSSQIKVLEQALDLKLFQKVGRNIELTQSGLIIYGYCRQMFELSDEMSELVSKRVPTASGRINIGITDEIDRNFVVNIVNLFLKKYEPQNRPKVTMISGSRDQLMDRLRFREFDAVVTEVAMRDPEIHNLVYTETPVVLASAQSSTIPLTTSQNTIDINETTNWIIPSTRLKLRAEIDQFLEENSIKGRIVFESDAMSTLVSAAVGDIGCALLPKLYIHKNLKNKSLNIIGSQKGYWKYKLWLVCHEKNKKDALVKALAQSFNDFCAEVIN
jgi:LysR family transcriptional activator of nhaA